MIHLTRSLALSALLACAAAQAVTLDLCVRGSGSRPPLQQTLRVQLTLGGAPLEADMLRPFAAQLCRATLWDGRAEQVSVEPFDEVGCAAALDRRAELSAEVSAAEVAELRRSLNRGEGLFATIADVARRTVARLDSTPASAAATRQWLRVFYASNRKPGGSTDTAAAFGSERVDELAWGAIDVAVLNQATMRDLESPALLRVERATSLEDFQLAPRIVPMTLEQWRVELRQRASRFEQPGVLLFIHGYNVSFVAAAQRAAQLAFDLAFPGPTAFFAWPSDASVVKYLQDGRDARNSRPAAARVLGEVAGLLPSGPVYVVAHSMGNRVLTEGLMQMLEDEPGKRRAIREVVMAAPDVDQEDFRLNIAPRLLPSGPRFTLYASDRDLALSISERLQGGKRLGDGGAALYVQRGLDSIDASSVTKEFFALNHSYFGDKTTVLADLFFLIRQRLPPAQRPNLRSLSLPAGSAWAF